MATDADKSALLHDATTTPRDGRRERGADYRERVPHSKHAGWKMWAKRPDPLSTLQAAEADRVHELIPIRYGRMQKSPFTFFRGAAAVMADDLSETPFIPANVQSCGDCHALNFGAFATPERQVVFDINDFDETLPAPWEWDLKRLTVSLVLLARDNGLKAGIGADAARAATRSYREHINTYSRMAVLDIWYERIEWERTVESIESENLKRTLAHDLKKAQKKDNKFRSFPKMAHEEGGVYRITDNPPLIYHPKNSEQFVEEMKEGLRLYRDSLQDDKQRLFDRYVLCDVAMKVVGIGSVGTTCAIALLLAPDSEPLFLQIKQAGPSVLEKHGGKSAFTNHGQRVVAGQRIVQSASDIFLGWMQLGDGRDFYVRQLRDTKVKITTEEWDADSLISMSGIMGAVLAKAHARSGDSAVISGYLGDTDSFDLAIADFSMAYADQTEKDWAALKAAIASGRIKAADDV